MAYASSVAQVATTTSDLFDKVETFILARGWTKHDDQRSGSDYVVYKSLGEDGSEELYIHIFDSVANKLSFKAYDYWDSATHTGVRGAYSVSYSFVFTDDDASFNYWIYGSKDAISLVTKVSSIYYWKYFGLIDRTWSSDKAITSNSETAGSDVVIEVDNTTYFTVNDYYIICDKDNMERIQITTISGSSVTATLSNSYSVGAKIGEDPQPNIVSTHAPLGPSDYMTNKYDGWDSLTGQAYVGYPAVDSQVLIRSYDVERNEYRMLFNVFILATSAAYNEVRGTFFKVYTTHYLGISSEDTITVGGVVYDCFVKSNKSVCFPRT